MTYHTKCRTVMLLGGMLAWCSPLNAQEPEWVLDGTELVAIGDVRQHALPDNPEGSFVVEQGGSELHVSIAPGSGGDWIVQRTHQEPDGPEASRTYIAARQGDELASRNGDLRVRGAEVGILVREQASGTESIPAEYWILYYSRD